MRYSFMTFSCPELSLAEALAVAKRYGYDAIEPRIESGHKHGIEADASAARRKELRKVAADSGTALCCLATSCRFADPATLQENVEFARKAIDLAGDVGAPRMRVFGGRVGAGLTREQAIAQVSDALSGLADQAKDRGVTVCIETHDDWCEPDHIAAVLRRVSHPNIAANWDIMHPVRVAKRTMDEAFRSLKPWIRHIHCHDGITVNDKLQMVPIGQGDIDHARALALLKSLPYDGCISGEWINWEPYEQCLPRELATLRRMEAAL